MSRSGSKQGRGHRGHPDATEPMRRGSVGYVASMSLRSRRTLLLGIGGFFVASCIAGWFVVRSTTRDSGAQSVRVVVVAPDRAAAATAPIRGATPRERRALRASLALIGVAGASMRVRIADCPPATQRCARQHVSRALTIEPSRPASGAFPIRSTFLASLVAYDAADRLARLGERVGWQVIPNGQRYSLLRLSRPVSVARLRDAAGTIAARAAHAGWSLAPIRLYTTAAGAMEVTVRFDDRTLLTNRNTAFISTLYGPSFRPPIWHTLLNLEGPGGVYEGGGDAGVGASYGGDLRRRHPSGAPIPAWLTAKPTRLHVEIMAAGHRRPLRFTIDCAAGQARRATALCTRLLRERAVLFSPVQSDNTCLGGPTDSSSVRGEVAGDHARTLVLQLLRRGHLSVGGALWRASLTQQARIRV